MTPLRIVIIGPESTGKSVLCTQLAAHYQTSWCPEYAREYLVEHGTRYTYADLLTIATRQLEREDDCAAAVTANAEDTFSNMDALNTGRPLLFIDTDMYVMKVWCEFVFQHCHRFILNQIIERRYDLYLLCNTDLPWVKDELREYPDLVSRNTLFKMYKDLMINQSVPWVEIGGNYEQRLPAAIAAVDALLTGKMSIDR